jgi:Flp pilus assembly protein TadB
MSDTETTVLIVIVVAALLLAALAAYLMRKRAQEQRAHEAGELRDVAATHTHEVTEAEREARRKDAEAELARAEAERAEVEAQRARQGVVQTEATREHLAREADRIDPRVDTRSDDYTPTDPADRRDDGYTDDDASSPSHRA